MEYGLRHLVGWISLPHPTIFMSYDGRVRWRCAYLTYLSNLQCYQWFERLQAFENNYQDSLLAATFLY